MTEHDMIISKTLYFILVFTICALLSLCIFLLLKQCKKQKTSIDENQDNTDKVTSLESLTNGITHDFNNIFASISGYSDILNDELEDQKKLQQFSKQITRACRQGTELIEKIWMFSRTPSDRMQKINLIETIENISSHNSFNNRQKIDFQTNIDLDKAPFKMCSKQLDEFLTNIYENALESIQRSDQKDKGIITTTLTHTDKKRSIMKHVITDANLKTYTKRHKNRTVFTIGRLPPDADYISLCIQDNGIGISADIMPHILDPYFSTKKHGAGLGLSVGYNIIKTYDMAIIVSSEPNVTTSIEIIFPVNKGIENRTIETNVDIEPEDNLKVKTETYTTASLTEDDIHILLVEDDIVMATMMLHILERLGYDAIHCINAIDAVELLEDETHYNLIITDQKMPKMTGIELSHTLSKTHPDLPIILLSGENSHKIKQEHDTSCLSEILHKPTNSDTLSTAIKKSMAIRA